MWRVTIKGILAHKFRMVLTSVAVMLGVTFMAGTFVITDTIGGVFDDLFADAYKDVAVAVRTQAHVDSAQGGFVPGGGRQPVPASLVGTIEKVPGVRAVAGQFQNQYAQFVNRKNKPVKNGPAPTYGSN